MRPDDPRRLRPGQTIVTFVARPAMKIRDDSPPDWVFTVDELSAGVFEVVGRGPGDQSISRKGTDPEDLIARCKEDARAIGT
jgi:hypothetical protein